AIAQPLAAPPGVGEQQQPLQPLQPRPGVGENPGGGASDSFYPRSRETQPPPMDGAEGSCFRQPRLGAPVTPASPAPKVHIDRIAYLPEHNVGGQVVRADDRAPRAGARLLFVNAERDGDQQSVTSDGQGRFQATLTKGTWLVYVRNQ